MIQVGRDAMAPLLNHAVDTSYATEDASSRYPGQRYNLEVLVQKRSEDWCLGPRNPYTPEEAEWWARHTPTVDRWLTEMEEAGDEWWPSAAHAAFCLLSCRTDDDLGESWDYFDVDRFLFQELWSGGTVGIHGSVPIFFEHLVEALRRFIADGLVDAERGEPWLARMQAAGDDFMRCYSEETSERDAMEIAKGYLKAS